MESSQDFRGAFKVSCQSAEPGSPSEAALNNPSFRQQSESFLRFRQFNHNQFDACIFGRLSCIALIGVANLDRLFCDSLNFFGQLADLIPLLLISRCYVQGGKSFGSMRHCAPVRTSQRSPLNTSRRSWLCCAHLFSSASNTELQMPTPHHLDSLFWSSNNFTITTKFITGSSEQIDLDCPLYSLRPNIAFSIIETCIPFR